MKVYVVLEKIERDFGEEVDIVGIYSNEEKAIQIAKELNKGVEGMPVSVFYQVAEYRVIGEEENGQC